MCRKWRPRRATSGTRGTSSAAVFVSVSSTRPDEALLPEDAATGVRHRAAPLWRFLAAGVMSTHLIVSLFMVFGGVLVMRDLVAWWMHLPLAAWGVLVHSANITCPLTPLEKRFRRLAGQSVYEAGFVQRYIAPRGLHGRALDWAVVTLLVVVNAVVYATGR